MKTESKYKILRAKRFSFIINCTRFQFPSFLSAKKKISSLWGLGLSVWFFIKYTFESGRIFQIFTNITAFGPFLDLGIKESGLVHISQLKEGFVSDVNEVVKLQQQVMVKVLEVDEERKRVQLTMVL